MSPPASILGNAPVLRSLTGLGLRKERTKDERLRFSRLRRVRRPKSDSVDRFSREITANHLCVPTVFEGLAVWRHDNPKKNSRCDVRPGWNRRVQPPYKFGWYNIVVCGHRYQYLDRHIMRELLARMRRRARVFAGKFSWQSGVLQRHYTRAFEAHRQKGRKLIGLCCWGHGTWVFTFLYMLSWVNYTNSCPSQTWILFMYTSNLFEWKKISVEGWFISVQFWPWPLSFPFPHPGITALAS